MSPLLQAAVQCTRVDREDLDKVVRGAVLAGQSLIDGLLDQEAVDEGEFAAHLARVLDWRWLGAFEPVDAETAAWLKSVCPARLALKHRLLPHVLPRAKEGDEASPPYELLIVCYDPFDLAARQAVARAITVPCRWCLAPRSQLLPAIQNLYGVGADTFEDILRHRATDEDDAHMRDEANVIDADDAEASVVKFVNQIIREALTQRATDIHLEPVHDNLRIRYRVDGLLHEVPVPENIRQLQGSVLARVKVMAKLDIAEKRLPQDGRIHLRLENQGIDVRVATIPSVEGESISLRLLGQQRFTLDRLGFTPAYRAKIDQLLAKPNGIVLVTGPTGSGKSTTLYTFLSALNSIHRRIVTIEDPVEHKLPGVVQIAVKPEINLTFAAGLRSILRGDPNVVMIGEIRDLETAEIAVRASLTGHLVFSTLHTNDSIGGITRLVEMGVEPFLVATSVRAFLAQRLVRSLCPQCRVPVEYSEEKLRACGFAEGLGQTFYGANPGGCHACRSTGYHGRLAIYEIALLTPAIQDLVASRASANELLRQARAEGFLSLREYGWLKVLAGHTTVEEVMRVTSEDHVD
jgi:general secretion pathway protein E